MTAETSTAAAPAEGGRTLSLARAIFLGVGAMVGAGIFALLGEAGQVAGSAVWVSFLIGGIICLLQGYSFAKLGTRFPSRAGTLAYIAQGFGMGHITGSTAWLMQFTLVIVSAMVAVSFGGYGSALFFGDDAAPWVAKALAVVVVVAIMFVNMAGSTAVAKLSSLVVVTVTILIIFSVAGISQADPALLAPETYPPFRAILASVALTFFAFLGFGVIAFSAEDIQEPHRNLPRAMYSAILIATITYIAIAVAVFGTLTLDEVIAAGDNALAVAAEPIFGQLGFTVVSLVALLATTSALNSNLYAATGASKELGRNGLLPPRFAQPVGSGGTLGLVAAAALAAILAVTLDLSAIASLGSAVSLLVFVMASAAHLRVLEQTGARAIVIWAALVTAALTFVAFAVSTWLDAPETIILIIGFVIAAVVLDRIWSRERQQRFEAQASSEPPAPA